LHRFKILIVRFFLRFLKVKTEIRDLIDLKKDAKSDRALNRIQNKIDFLNTIILYLESNPREEFLQSEKLRLEKQGDNIEDNFDKWILADSSRKHLEKPRKVYYKEMKLDDVLKRLKTINYLLG